MRFRHALLPLIFSASGYLAAQAPAAPAQPAAAPGQAPAPDQDDITIIKAVPFATQLKRDPFATPTEDSNRNQGNLVEDIAVKGVVRGNDGKYLAVIVDSHGKTSFVPVGFKLRDGEIVAIDDHGVTFHQWELNTTNRSAYRTVVKKFKNEETK
jgi:hypothetical protein